MKLVGLLVCLSARACVAKRDVSINQEENSVITGDSSNVTPSRYSIPKHTWESGDASAPHKPNGRKTDPKLQGRGKGHGGHASFFDEAQTDSNTQTKNSHYAAEEEGVQTSSSSLVESSSLVSVQSVHGTAKLAALSFNSRDTSTRNTHKRRKRMRLEKTGTTHDYSRLLSFRSWCDFCWLMIALLLLFPVIVTAIGEDGNKALALEASQSSDNVLERPPKSEGSAIQLRLLRFWIRLLGVDGDTSMHRNVMSHVVVVVSCVRLVICICALISYDGSNESSLQIGVDNIFADADEVKKHQSQIFHWKVEFGVLNSLYYFFYLCLICNLGSLVVAVEAMAEAQNDLGRSNPLLVQTCNIILKTICYLLLPGLIIFDCASHCQPLVNGTLWKSRTCMEWAVWISHLLFEKIVRNVAAIMAYVMVIIALVLATARVSSTGREMQGLSDIEDMNVLWALVSQMCTRVSSFHKHLFEKLKGINNGISNIIFIAVVHIMEKALAMQIFVSIGATHHKNDSWTMNAVLSFSCQIFIMTIIVVGISLLNASCDNLMDDINLLHLHIFDTIKTVGSDSNGVVEGETTDKVESQRLAQQIIHFSMFRELNKNTSFGFIILGVRVSPVLVRGVLSTLVTVGVIFLPTISNFFGMKV